MAFLNSQVEEVQRAVAFLNSKLEERERAVAFLNTKLEERERAVAFLNTKLEERERAVAFLNAQLQEQIQKHTRATERLQQEHARLQQELQGARAAVTATSAELGNLRRTKFYRLAAFYWLWLDKLKTTFRPTRK